MRHPAATALLAAGLFGCERPSGEITAPVIHFGQDTCAACSMIISDERFAGAIGVRDGGEITYLLFDDVGEMLAFAPGAHDAVRWFAADADTRAWLDAEQAVFLRSDDLMTPMGTGIGAYKTREAAARARGEHGGDLLDFSELRGAD